MSKTDFRPVLNEAVPDVKQIFYYGDWNKHFSFGGYFYYHQNHDSGPNLNFNIMNHNDLPQRWKNKITEFLKENGSKYNTLGAGDFSDKTVEISFEDGSSASFRYPIVIEAPEFNEIGIMTEHCGYFIFHEDTITYQLK